MFTGVSNEIEFEINRVVGSVNQGKCVKRLRQNIVLLLCESMEIFLSELNLQ